MTKLNQYQNYLEKRKLLPSTIKMYLWHLGHFLAWLDNKKLTSTELKKYYQFLLSRYKTIASVNLRLVIINNYLKHIKHDFQFDLLSAKSSDIKILTKKQLTDFLDLPTKKTDILHLRDKLILELLYYTGLKPSQLAKIKREQINLTKNYLKIAASKIPLTETTKFYLTKYLNKRTDASPWLLINLDRANKHNDQPLTIRSLERIVEKYARLLQPILNISPQTLRHTRAYHLKKDGGTARTIQDSLRLKTKIGAEQYYKKL